MGLLSAEVFNTLFKVFGHYKSENNNNNNNKKKFCVLQPVTPSHYHFMHVLLHASRPILACVLGQCIFPFVEHDLLWEGMTPYSTTTKIFFRASSKFFLD
ncbi:hypothetical protein HanIR_Chr03g0144401 [Helianthus annuus]|nr:hypothetical protein HanIR_Chr03g0144401 [Helianthus annuus]